VGLLIEVARGYRPLEEIDQILSSSKRPNAGYCAPANGLFLHKVLYDAKWNPSKVLESHE
jgi:tRNA U38,U39,U40 pseudouridine synthase TruA